MASTFTATGSTGGAFDCEAGEYAIGRSAITTAAPSSEVSFSFTITRRPLVMRVGTTAGAQDIIEDATFEPGDHVYSFTPGVSPYYVEFQLREVGEAVLSGFARVAPGLLTLPTPYATAFLRSIRSEQSLNVQWLADGFTCPRALERRGNSSWSMRLFQPKDGPFENDDTSDTTMTPSALTGTATVTASTAVFKQTDVGSLIRLTQAGQFETASGGVLSATTDSIRVAGSGAAARTFYYTVSGTFTASVTLQRSVGNELNFVDVVTVTTATSASLYDSLDAQVVYYRLKVTAYTSGTAVMSLTYSGGLTDGIGRIFSVDADNAVTVDVLEPFATTTATSIWARGSWSDRFGWPTAPALFDGRLTWLRSGRRWQSASDDFESYKLGAEDADAISGSIPGQLNFPVWMKAAERLVFGTSGGEGFFTTGSMDDVMTPSNTRARVRTQRGSYGADATLAEGAPVYIDRSGRELAIMLFNGDSSYDLFNLARMHRDIAGVGSGALIEVSYQTKPEKRIYAVRDDGQCAVQLLDLNERIGGFSRIVPVGTNAAIESVCAMPAAPEDAIFRVVKRTIDGGTTRYVEKLSRERWTDSTLAWRLECAIEYDGAATTAITGLDHLEGEDVYAWGDGRISGPYEVTSGAITLDYEVEYAIIGLRYQGRYKGPRVASGGSFGGTLTQYKKVERLGLLLLNTPGGGISWGRSLSALGDTLPDRSVTGTFDSPLELQTGDFSFPINGSWDKDARVCIQMNGTGPATVLGLVVGAVTNER